MSKSETGKYERGNKMEIKSLKKSATQITRYEYGEFYVDIVKCFTGNGGGYYEAWFRKDGYGVESMMFGLRATSRKDFLSIVECNIDEYIKMYEDMHCKEEI